MLITIRAVSYTHLDVYKRQVLFYGRDLADCADGVFSYKMREHLMEAITALEERGVFPEMKEANKEFDKNLILYGPRCV